MIRTRFAPSPTGFIHVGNLRSAIFTYLIAKHQDGKFILRLEDTDRERFIEGAADVIYNTLEQCNLKYDEGPNVGGEFGPYVQSERKGMYKDYALELVEKGEAYYCFCDEERLKSIKDNNEFAMYDKHCLSLSKEEIEDKIKNNVPYVIRHKTPDEGETAFTCEVYGTISINNSEIEDQVLLKSDGYPTYNFANVVDDHLMNITHVARGNEYLTSTPKYNLLYKAFGWEQPKYIHLPHVVNHDGKKLSKRNGDAYFSDFVEKGYLPDAIVNYLSLLGWSPQEEKEIFTLKELEEQFDYKRISNSPAVFDEKKLMWINSHYIKQLSAEDLASKLSKYLPEENEDMLVKVANIFKDRLNYLSEIRDLYKEFFTFKDETTQEAQDIITQDGVKNTLQTFVSILENTEWNYDAIKSCIKQTGKDAGAKGKMLFMPVRIAVTKEMHGPDLPLIIEVLSKEEVIRRVNLVINTL